MASTDVLRVVTFNVYGPANPGWDSRHDLIRRTLRDLDADVLALQEVPVTDDGFFDDLLGAGYHLGHFSQPSPDGVAGPWPRGGRNGPSSRSTCGSASAAAPPCRGAPR